MQSVIKNILDNKRKPSEEPSNFQLEKPKSISNLILTTDDSISKKKSFTNLESLVTISTSNSNKALNDETSIMTVAKNNQFEFDLSVNTSHHYSEQSHLEIAGIGAEKTFLERLRAAQTGEWLDQYMFKDPEIRSYFPDGVIFIMENDDKNVMKAKISQITDVDQQVAFYIDANESQLNSIIIGNHRQALVINTYLFTFKSVNALKKLIYDQIADYKYKKVFYNTRFVENIFQKWFNKEKIVSFLYQYFLSKKNSPSAITTKFATRTTLPGSKMGLVFIYRALSLEFWELTSSTLRMIPKSGVLTLGTIYKPKVSSETTIWSTSFRRSY